MLSTTRLTDSSVARYSTGLLAVATMLLFLWPGLWRNLFASGFGVERFMPQGHCYLWVPSLVILHVGADLLIGVSYIAISITLAYLVHRARRDIPFHWVFLAFGLFIVACGATHLMEVWTLWNATYWLSGYVKLITAAASLATAVALPVIIPKTLQLISDAKVADAHKADLELINQALEREILERKQAEERLQETSQTLQAIFQASPLAIYAVGVDGKVLTWNPAAERVFNRTAQEAVGNLLPMLLDESLAEFREIFERVLHGQSFADVELQLGRRDGSVFYLSSSTAPLRDSVGKVVGMLGITADVGERKRAEEEQRRSEEKYRIIFDYAAMGIYQSAPDGTLTNANPTLARMLGYDSPEDLNGRSLPDDIYEQRADQNRLLAAYDRPGYASDIEVRWKKKDGTLIWVQLNSRAIRNELGETAHFDGFVYDITKRRHAEDALQAERILMRTLFEQLPVGVLIRDLEGKWTHVNKASSQMLGLDEIQLIGVTVEELYRQVKATKGDGVPLESHEIPSNIALRLMRATAPQELNITRPDGGKRRLSVTASPLGNNNDEMFGAVTVITDITERYVLEDQLRQSQKMESIGTLAGGVAHDFNNLLTVILGYTQIAMKNAPVDLKVFSQLSQVEKAANRATTLTRQLLAFSRRQRLERKSVNLNDIINDVTKMLQRIIGEDVTVRISESEHLFPVFVDPAQMEQVIMNLAVNSRDAMPRGGELLIETRNITLDENYQREHPYSTPGDYVELVVSDTGVGMDPETKLRIFEPFFTTKEVGRGTGLGLSTVYGIVKQHQGMIEVYSEHGEGTSIKIYFPVYEKPAVEEKEQGVLPPVQGGGETILVAEDEEALRKLAKGILEDLGYTVLLAQDGLEAAEIFEADPDRISLVLLDIVMPKLGGRETYQRISSIRDDVPVIFMTGYSAEIVQNQFVKQNKFIEEAGARLIQKPYSVEMLGRAVREVLDSALHKEEN